METVFRQIGDLDQSDRSALERVVGHALRQDQQVMIQVIDETTTPNKSNGQMVADELPEWCNVFEELTAEEIADLEGAIIRDYGSRS
jgi:hypothetical protein